MPRPKSFLTALIHKIRGNRFSSRNYWESRYAAGGNSGGGSYGHLAEYKAEILNKFVADNSIRSIVEFGCGDGNQLRLSKYPSYIGYDVSNNAIGRCREIFSGDHTKQFHLLDQYDGRKFDMSMSLDVIFHLVEDDVYQDYMHRLFGSASLHVVVYSSNMDETPPDKAVHVRHRKFTEWVSKNHPDWKLKNVIANKYPYNGDYMQTSFADFYFYGR